MASNPLDDILRRVATERSPRSGLTTSNLRARPGATGRSPLPANLSLANRINVLGQQQESDDGFGWRDVLGGAWDGWNVVKKLLPGYGAVSNLGLVDVPRRVVASTYATAKETPVLKDMIGVTPAGLLESGVRKVNDRFRDGGVEAEGRANVFDQSWAERIKNPEFGYGQIFFDSTKGGFETAVGGFGGRTLDKVVGFTGDVAMDPLSWVGGSTSGTVGLQNRYALAAEAAVKGLGDDVVSGLSTRGASTLSDAIRPALNVPQRGLRFGSQSGRGVRIPGTAALDDLFSGAASGARNAVTSSRIYDRVIGTRRAPEGMEAVYRVLRRGFDETGELSPTAAALAFDFSNNLKAYKGMFAGTAQRSLSSQFRDASVETRTAWTHAAEAGDNNVFADALGMLREQLKADGVDIGFLENYAPHLWTRDAADFLWGNTELAQKLRGELAIDPTVAPGITKGRVIKPGSEITVKRGGGTVSVKFVDGTIVEINEKLSKAFPELGIKKWLEDDSGRLIQRYIDQAASASAQVRAFERLAAVAPEEFVRRVGDVSTSVLDEVATKTANKKLKATLKQLVEQRTVEHREAAEAMRRQVEDLKPDFVAALRVRLDGLGSEAQGLAAKVDAINSKIAGFDESIKQLGRTGKELRGELTSRIKRLYGEIDRLFAAEEQLRIAVQAGPEAGVSWDDFVEGFIRRAKGDRKVAADLAKEARIRAEVAAENFEVALADLQMIDVQMQDALWAYGELGKVVDAAADPAKLRQMVEERNPGLFEEFIQTVKGGVEVRPTSEAVVRNAVRKRRDVRAAELLVEIPQELEQSRRLAGSVKEHVSASLNDVARLEKKVAAAEKRARGPMRALRDRAGKAGEAVLGRLEVLSSVMTRTAQIFETVPVGDGGVAVRFGVDAVDPAVREVFAEVRRLAGEAAGRAGMVAEAGGMAAEAAAELAGARSAADVAGLLSRGVNPTDGSRMRQTLQSVMRAKNDLPELESELERAARVAVLMDSLHQTQTELLGTAVDDVKAVADDFFALTGVQIPLTAEGAIDDALMSQMYQQAREQLSSIVENLKVAKPIVELQKSLADLKEARQVYARAVKKDREVTVALSKLERGVETGNEIKRRLAPLEDQLKLAEKRVRNAGEVVSRLLPDTEVTAVRPVVAGGDPTRLPYEAEAIQMSREAQEASTPLRLKKGDPVGAAIANPNRFDEMITRESIPVEEQVAAEYDEEVGKLLDAYFAEPEKLTDEQIVAAEEAIESTVVGASDDVDVIETASELSTQTDGAKAPFGGKVQTREQRLANLRKAQTTRQYRSQIKDAISLGEMSLEDVFQLAKTEAMLQKMRVADVLAADQNLGRARAFRLMHESGVSGRDRLGALVNSKRRAGRFEKLQSALRGSKDLALKDAQRDRQALRFADLFENAKDANGNQIVPVEVSSRLTDLAVRIADDDELIRLRHQQVFVSEHKIEALSRRLDSLTDKLYRESEQMVKLREEFGRYAPSVQRKAEEVAELEQTISLTTQMLEQAYDSAVLSSRASERVLPHSQRAAIRDEIDQLVDFGERYLSAVEAGAKPGDSLAARVTAHIKSLEKKRLDERARAAGKALEALQGGEELSAVRMRQARTLLDPNDRVVDELAFEQFRDLFVPMFEVLEGAAGRARWFRNYSKKLKRMYGVGEGAEAGLLVDETSALTQQIDIPAGWMSEGENPGFRITQGADVSDAELKAQIADALRIESEYEDNVDRMLGQLIRFGRVERQSVYGGTADVVQAAGRAADTTERAAAAQEAKGLLRFQIPDLERRVAELQSKVDLIKLPNNVRRAANAQGVSEQEFMRRFALERSKNQKLLDEATARLEAAKANRPATASGAKASKAVERYRKSEVAALKDSARQAEARQALKTQKPLKQIRRKLLKAMKDGGYAGFEQELRRVWNLTDSNGERVILGSERQKFAREASKRGGDTRRSVRVAQILDDLGYSQSSSRITVDWRHVLGVAEDGYVSPLEKLADKKRVVQAYKNLTDELSSGMRQLEREINALTYSDSAPVRSKGQRVYDEANRRLEIAASAERELAAAEELLAGFGRDESDFAILLQALHASSQRRRQISGEADDLLARAEDVADLVGTYENLRVKIDAQVAAETLTLGNSKRYQKILKGIAGGERKAVEADMRDINNAITQLEKLDPSQAKSARAEFKVVSKIADPDTTEGLAALTAYADYVVEAVKVDKLSQQVDLLTAYKKAAQIGSKTPDSEKALTKIFKRQMNEGFIAMGEAMGPEKMLGVAEPLANAIRNIEKVFEKGGFWESIELANRVFKTYATLTPGFHLRNFLGASVMNASDGVGPGYTVEAFRVMSQYKKDPVGFVQQLRKQAAQGDQPSARLFHAMEATYGSGASGRLSFGEIGKSNANAKLVRRAMDTKVADFVLENAAVRFSQQAGTDLVEFPIRLAMALNSLDRGMSPQQAIARIKRVHFDYSDLSRFDQKMKALIPFWVFMSRNLPLQFQQMLTKPKIYRMYDSLVRNFGVADMEMLQWQEERGGVGILTDSSLFGGSQDIVAMPDLQHISMFDDISKANPTDPLRFLSQMNPMVRVPAELAMNRKFYSGQPFYPDENKLQYAALQAIPPFAQGSRLTGVGPYEQRSRLQSALNYVGIPLWAVDNKKLLREMERRNS